MLMKNQKLCRQCFFGWCPGSAASGTKPYCEYYLVTGKTRQNTADTCQSYIKGFKKGLTTEDKQLIYNRIISEKGMKG